MTEVIILVIFGITIGIVIRMGYKESNRKEEMGKSDMNGGFSTCSKKL